MYKGYKGLPSLVGMLSIEEAMHKGFSVEESVEKLKRFHWTLKRLSKILSSHITGMPVYELKMAFSLHSHLCAEHVSHLFERVREMREPPYGMEASPNKELELLLDEVNCAPTTEALLLGIYEKIIPNLIKGFKNYLSECNKLFEHPTFRVCRFALIELQDIDNYGKEAIKCIVEKNHREQHNAWLNLLEQCIENMGGLDGTSPKKNTPLTPIHSSSAYSYIRIPQRDERFKDLYNLGVNAEDFLSNPGYDAQSKLIMLYFKRLREIDVPEMMASIIYDVENKPWAYYKDMMRQLWDEARHAMMGEVGFISIGVDWTKIPLTHAWSLQLNTKLTPKERHAVLFFIEQGLMPAATGKKFEWDIATQSNSKLAQLIQDYDWADEVLHARIGRDWIVPEIGTQKETMEYGSKAWNSVYLDWNEWLKKEYTQHHNWFPEIYKDACKYWNITPNPEILNYKVSYKTKRADNRPLMD